MQHRAAITGIGVLTPAGDSPAAVRAAAAARVAAGETRAEGRLRTIGGCPVQVAGLPRFSPEEWVPEPKSIRMMSRDAQLAVAAATLAARDAGLVAGETYPAGEVGLFGATGLAGLPLEEVERLIRASAGDGGQLDLHRFGETALRQVRPVLSFKILANMPICFVSIFLNLQGPNAIFNPWEGQGAAGIDAGVACIERGQAAAAVVGGCDVKTHELGLLALRQQGVLCGRELLVGEGAAFLVLEDEGRARQRGARIYATLSRGVPGRLAPAGRPGGIVVAEGSSAVAAAEQCSWAPRYLSPKAVAGDLFAAAAALQVAVAADWCAGGVDAVTACCFGHGGEECAFHLERA